MIDYTKHDEHYFIELPLDETLPVSGDGLWGAEAGHIKVSKVEIETAALDDDGWVAWRVPCMCVYFDPAEWDVREKGLIYTDSGFLEALKDAIRQRGWLSEAELETLHYSEQGAQAHIYIHLMYERVESWPYGDNDDPILEAA